MKRQKLIYLNTLLASVAILLSGLVYANSLSGDRDIQDARAQRTEEQAFADLVICARGNYQDSYDKHQDQLFLDLVSTPPDALGERRLLFRSAARQLGRRLNFDPPNLRELVERWKGDRGDRLTSSTDCTKLPSQRRPFTR